MPNAIGTYLGYLRSTPLAYAAFLYGMNQRP